MYSPGFAWLSRLFIPMPRLRSRPQECCIPGAPRFETPLDLLAREHPDTNEGVRVTVLPERLARPEEGNAQSNQFAAAALLGLVALVFLVAAVNVTSLLLARSLNLRLLPCIVRSAHGAPRAMRACWPVGRLRRLPRRS